MHLKAIKTIDFNIVFKKIFYHLSLMLNHSLQTLKAFLGFPVCHAVAELLEPTLYSLLCADFQSTCVTVVLMMLKQKFL